MQTVVAGTERPVYGNLHLVFIANVLFVIQIFGHLTGKFSLLKDTGRLVRKVKKQVILKDLIAQ